MTKAERATFTPVLPLRLIQLHPHSVPNSRPAEIDHLGVWLAVVEEGVAAPAIFFFEARFPPGVWRHLCLQHRPGKSKVSHSAKESL